MPLPWLRPLAFSKLLRVVEVEKVVSIPTCRFNSLLIWWEGLPYYGMLILMGAASCLTGLGDGEKVADIVLSTSWYG